MLLYNSSDIQKHIDKEDLLGLVQENGDILLLKNEYSTDKGIISSYLWSELINKKENKANKTKSPFDFEVDFSDLTKTLDSVFKTYKDTLNTKDVKDFVEKSIDNLDKAINTTIKEFSNTVKETKENIKDDIYLTKLKTIKILMEDLGFKGTSCYEEILESIKCIEEDLC